jgi:hypothetical protein
MGCSFLSFSLNIGVDYKLAHNGTAIEGVCVTGAVNRLKVLFVSTERVTVASRYGAVFAPSCAAGFAIAVHDESL